MIAQILRSWLVDAVALVCAGNVVLWLLQSARRGGVATAASDLQTRYQRLFKRKPERFVTESGPNIGTRESPAGYSSDGCLYSGARLALHRLASGWSNGFLVVHRFLSRGKRVLTVFVSRGRIPALFLLLNASGRQPLLLLVNRSGCHEKTIRQRIHLEGYS